MQAETNSYNYCQSGMTGVAGPLDIDNGAPTSTWEHETIAQAAWNCNLKVLERLVAQAKAGGSGNPSSAQPVGYGPTHFAAALGNPEVLELLLSNGIDKDERDAEGNSPLIWVVTSDGPEEMLESLVDHGASINLMNFAGETALSLACQRGFVGKAEYLLENGADPNTANIDGATPLHAAAAFGDAALVSLLVRWGAHINATDDEGDSPLHWAVREDKHAAALRLIELGADVSLANEDGENPIELLLACGDQETANKLVLFVGATKAAVRAECYTAHEDNVMSDDEEMGGCLKSLSVKDFGELRTTGAAPYNVY